MRRLRRNTSGRLILVLNLGSTSTKLALYRDDRVVIQRTAHHSRSQIAGCRRLADQLPMREAAVLAVLREVGVTPADLDAVAARGGVLAACRAGTYRIGDQMARDARSNRYGTHATNLGVLLARDIARHAAIPAFTVNPPTVDEMCPEARYSGIPQIIRKARWHALNQKTVACRVAARLNKPYRKINMVIAHLGGGISVAAHRHGRAIDVNNALDGDGPFGIERSGGLPVGDLVRLTHRLPLKKVLRLITGQGGVIAYLGTNDMREVERRVRDGDAAAREVINAMAWQVAKEIGACAAILSGQVDAVVLTGSLARWGYLVGRIRRHVRFIAPVHVVPGEMELDALARGTLQALTRRTRVHNYCPRAGA